MSTIEYKGYQGTSEVSIEDGCLHGRILHIVDVVSYGADSVPELEEAFKKTVDHYVSHCESKGREPNKPFKGTLNVRLSPEMHKQAAHSATRRGESINSFINQAVEAFIKNETQAWEGTKNTLSNYTAPPSQINAPMPVAQNFILNTTAH